MVGWGGFGAANAGAAIMVRAAAKEPAIVALANAFWEFIAIIVSRGLSDVVFRWREHRFRQRLAGESGGRVQGNPDARVTGVLLFRLRPTSSRFRDRNRSLQHSLGPNTWDANRCRAACPCAVETLWLTCGATSPSWHSLLPNPLPAAT